MKIINTSSEFKQMFFIMVNSCKAADALTKAQKEYLWEEYLFNAEYYAQHGKQVVAINYAVGTGKMHFQIEDAVPIEELKEQGFAHVEIRHGRLVLDE